MSSTARSTARYSAGAIAFHWIIALLILLNYVAVWVASTMPKPEKMQVMANHKAIGLTILTLSVLRILWRLTHRAPPFAAGVKRWEAALARTVHTLFYVLIIAIPLTGWAMVSSFGAGKPVSWFGLVDVPALPVSSDRATSGAFNEAHELLAIAVLLLLMLHVAGALKHQFFDRDGTLGRMVPFLRRV